MSAESLVLQLLGSDAVAAAQAVAEAVSLAEWVQREGTVGTVPKSDESPVTVADFAVQALIAARLASAFPGVPLVAEEDASLLRCATVRGLQARVVDFVRRFQPDVDAARVLGWIDKGTATPNGRYRALDPIDGTKGFLRGGQYAVALALIEDGTVALGMLGCPRLSFRGAQIARTPGEEHGPGFAIAVRGRGAWWVSPLAEEMTRLSVSSATDPARARVLHSVETAHSDAVRLERVLHALGSSVEPLFMDSQAKHVVLAAGRADLLLRFPTNADSREAIWDHAAGSLLISEAGGHVSDLSGRALDFSTGRRLMRNNGLLASNGWLHDATLRAIEAVRSSDGAIHDSVRGSVNREPRTGRCDCATASPPGDRPRRPPLGRSMPLFRLRPSRSTTARSR